MKTPNPATNMSILINKVTRRDSYTYMSFSCGKMSADVSVGPHGVQVLNKNASHRAWGGIGRHFSSFAEARAGYKSSAMKSMIEAAEKLSAA